MKHIQSFESFSASREMLDEGLFTKKTPEEKVNSELSAMFPRSLNKEVTKAERCRDAKAKRCRVKVKTWLTIKKQALTIHNTNKHDCIDVISPCRKWLEYQQLSTEYQKMHSTKKNIQIHHSIMQYITLSYQMQSEWYLVDIHIEYLEVEK